MSEEKKEKPNSAGRGFEVGVAGGGGYLAGQSLAPGIVEFLKSLWPDLEWHGLEPVIGLLIVFITSGGMGTFVHRIQKARNA